MSKLKRRFFFQANLRPLVLIDCGVFVGEGDEVSCSATAIADDDWNRRLVVHVDEHCLYRVGASFHHQAHERYGVVVLERDWTAPKQLDYSTAPSLVTQGCSSRLTLFLDGHVHYLWLWN